MLGRRRGGYRRSRPRIGTADGWPAPRAGRALLVAGWLLAVGLSVVLASARSAAVTPSSGAITGTVTDQQGRPAAGVSVDLFSAPAGDQEHGRPTTGAPASATGEHAGFVASTSTDASGRYRIDLATAGCYVVEVIAPPGGALSDGSGRGRVEVCAGAGSTVGGIDAVLASTEQSQIRGQVTHENGARVAGAQVQLYAAAGDGSRGAFLRSTATDDAGWYSFDLPAACYIVVLVAPDGERFQSGATTDRRKLCIGEGAALTPVDGVLAGWARSPTALSAVELEMVRLTNELRANPAGPLARRAPLPSCVDDAFYRLSVDPATGHPTAAPPLTVDELVSVEMARVWSVEMERSAGFEHRASTSQEQTYAQLGVAVEAWGENIAWLAGFGRAAAARIHFEGWRESETGHYCAMLSPRFSHIGVGEHWSDDESWAVQNFYRPR